MYYELRIFKTKGENKPQVYTNNDIDILYTLLLQRPYAYYTLTKVDTTGIKPNVELINCK